MGVRIRGAALAASVAGLAFLAAPAGATTRYASTNGSPIHPTCDSGHPCTIVRALGVAVDSDEVVVRGGSYSLPAGLTTSKHLFIHGDFAADRPKVSYGGAASVFDVTGGKLEHLQIEALGDNRAITATDLDMRDLFVSGAATGHTLVWLLHGGVVRDSVFWATGQASTAFAGQRGQIALRNVTAWQTGTNGTAISGTSDGTGTASLELRNTIARGVFNDIAIYSQSGYLSTVTVRHDNFVKVTQSGPNTDFNDLGNNQTASPVLQDPANGNFHQVFGSPTLDAGSAAGLVPLGPTDFDGDQRVVDGAPDIGADERTPPPGASQQPAMLVGSTVATATGTVDPNGGATTYYFLWGEPPGYAHPSGFEFLFAVRSVGNGFDPVPVSLKLTGLKPNTTYHYRIRGTNATGHGTSQEQTFTTAAPGTPDPGGSEPQPGQPGGAILTLTKAFVKPARFRVAAGRTALSARRRPIPRGTSFGYTLSAPATVKIVIRRKLPGRRKGKSCLRPTRALRRAKRCTRLLTKATLTRGSKLGANTVRFTGRIGRRKLAPGKYAAVLTATDAAGNRSKSRTLAFTILPG